MFEYQDDAIKNLSCLDKEKKSYSTIVAIPTGGGKTRIAIRYLDENVFGKKGNKVLWIAERLALLKQTDDVFEKHTNSNIARCYLSSKSENFDNTDIQDQDLIIITQQTLSRKLNLEGKFKDWVKSGKTLTVIIDEAHHATSEPYLRILRYIKSLKSDKDNVHIIGLTATPLTEDLEKIFRYGVIETKKGEAIIKRSFSTNTSYAYQISMNTLISKGVLSKPKLFKVDFSSTDMRDEIKVVKKVADTYCSKLKGIKDFGKTIIFMPSRRSALELEYNLKEKGINCGLAISIDNTILKLDDVEKNSKYQYIESQRRHIDEERKRIACAKSYKEEKHFPLLKNRMISDYIKEKSQQVKGDINKYKGKDGSSQIDVLISVQMLQEGIDIPNTETVFIADAKSTELQVTQMIGRGLRGVMQGGTETANIVGFGDDVLKKIVWSMPDLKPTEEKISVKNSKKRGKDSASSPLDIDDCFEAIMFLLYGEPDSSDYKKEIKDFRRSNKLKIKGKIYYPTAYYAFYKRCIFEWNNASNRIVKCIRDNIQDIYKCALPICKTDDELRRVLDTRQDFKELYTDIIEEQTSGISGFGFLGELINEDVDFAIYYMKNLLWLYLESDKNIKEFKRDLKRNEFKRISISDEVEKCKGLKRDEQKKVLKKLWRSEKDKSDLIWETEEEYIDYVTNRIENLLGVSEMPMATEPNPEIETSTDDYFSVRLHRDGRKRKDLVMLLKYIIEGQDLTNMSFYDVFGGTGTVTANMEGFIKGIRYFNEFDASVANFIWHCSRNIVFILKILSDYKVSDMELAKYCATSEYLIEKELDEIGDIPISSIRDMAKNIASNPEYLLQKKDKNKELRLSDKYDDKMEKLFNASLNNYDKGNNTRAKQLEREFCVLMEDSVTSYMKVYIALWYSCYKYIAENAENEGWRKQIDKYAYSDDEVVKESSRDAVFKFLFVHGFSSRQVAISDATGIDKAGVEAFRRSMDNNEKSWLIEFHTRLKGVKITSKDFKVIMDSEEGNMTNTIYYLDPPYFLTKQYNCGFSDDNHLEMLKWLRETTCKWVFSCKSYVTNNNIPAKRKSKNFINDKKDDVYSLEEYFKLFIYPPQNSKKEHGRQVIYADMTKAVENLKDKLYVYYNYLDDNEKMQNQKVSDKEKKFLWCSDYEIMISNIPPNKEESQVFEPYNFKCESFCKFFNEHYNYNI